MSLAGRFPNMKTKAELKSRPEPFEEMDESGSEAPTGRPRDAFGYKSPASKKSGRGDVYSFENEFVEAEALKLKRRLQKKYISPDEIEPDPIPTRGLFQDDYYEDDEDGFDEFEDGNDDEGRPARGGAAPPSVVRRRPGKGKKPAAAPPPPPPKKRRQQCDLCLKEFAEMEEFETHIIREHGKEPMECDMCKIMFATQVAYRGHVEKHKDDVFYTCDFCDEAFTSEAALDRHVEEAHASYDCELCGEKFDVRRDLDRHATKKHGGAKLHHCEKCDRFFILKALMIGHQCQKRGEYYCQLCERDFTTNQGLQLHLRGHPADRARSATRRANCEVCHKELDACYMDKHMRTMHSKTVERPYGCEECGRRFTEVFHLKEHMESHKKRQFQCAECGASFSTKRYLEKHLKLGHVSKQRKPNRKPWTVECQLCSKVFTKASIDTHVAIKHSGKTPHVCLICGKAYATEAALAKHQDIHTKNYQCGTCGKRYASESEVVKHATLHQERSRLYCHICEKQFLREKNFNKHMETHGVSKQGKKKKGKGANTGSFQCIRCFRLFKNSRSLELHFRQHTGEKPYPCDRCKKRFAYPFALASHKKKEHADEESTSSEDTTGYENQDQPRDDVYLPDDDYPASYPATTTARHDVRRKQTFTSSAGNNVYYIANQAKTTYTGSTGYSPAKVSSVWSPPKTAGGSTLWNPARDTNRVLTPGVAGFAHDLRFGVPVDEAGWSNLQTTQVQTQQTYSNPPVAHTTSYIPQQTVQVQYNAAPAEPFVWNNREWSVEQPTVSRPQATYYNSNTGYQF